MRKIAWSTITVSALAICFATGAGASSANAQSTGSVDASSNAQSAPEDVPGEIVVTAQKRSQRAQDVGIAISALGNEQLSTVNALDLTQMAKIAPALQVNQYNAGFTVFSIRGISQNNFLDGQEAPIAFYNDEVYVGDLGAVSGQTYDLERVEILRGPQGTLFGRNATGGLIQVITAKPTAHWSGFATVKAGSYGQFSTEAAISGPLTEHIRFRLSGTTDRNHGYARNITLNRRELNANFYALRGQIEFDVGDNGLLRLKAEYMRNKDERVANSGRAAIADADGLGRVVGPNENPYGTCNGCNALGFKYSDDPYTTTGNFPAEFNREFYSLTARYEHDFGGVQLASITNYNDLNKPWTQDFDGSPSLLLENYGNLQKSHQFSQELRLSGKSSKLEWVAGAYYLNLKFSNDSLYPLIPASAEVFAGVPYGTFRQNINLRPAGSTDTVAIFGQGEYSINDVFSVIGGLRYNIDWKTSRFVNEVTYPSFGGAVDIYDFAARRPDLAKPKFENWNGKFQINAKVNRDLLIYAGVNRGTKSGGFNFPLSFPSPLANPALADPALLAAALNAFDSRIVFKQEVLTNYEGGIKLSFGQNLGTLNAAVFHYVYDDYQSFQTINNDQFITNAPARDTGAELELTLRPIRGLNISGFVTHLFERSIKNVVLPSGRISSRLLPQAPKWSLGGSVSLEVPVGNIGFITGTTSWKYNTSYYLSDYNSPISYQPAYALGDVRVSFNDTSNRFEVAAFVNNVTDREYRVFNADFSFASLSQDNYARPRWFGASFTYRFGR